jgi:hypothetical protein
MSAPFAPVATALTATAPTATGPSRDEALARTALQRLRDLGRDVLPLLREPRVGAAQAETIRLWLSDVATGAADALSLERIELALIALCIAHLCMFSYARGAGQGLWMTDRGGAVAMRRARDAAGALAVALHGEDGLDAVLRARAADEQRVRDIGRRLGMRWF